LIVNVRGTHGSGKTTLVRRVMSQYKRCKPIFIDGRRQPIGYVCDKKLFVAGHYEGEASGGCDTIPKVDLMYGMIQKYAKRGLHVLFEGILAQHSVPRILDLKERGFRVHIVLLDIPVEKAVKSVKKRRAVRGDVRKFDPTNTIRESRVVQNSSRTLKANGIRVSRHATRKSARARVFDLLELS
jgi:predicted ABC-type ATPase